jgi:hypothetical protein
LKVFEIIETIYCSKISFIGIICELITKKFSEKKRSLEPVIALFFIPL